MDPARVTPVGGTPGEGLGPFRPRSRTKRGIDLAVAGVGLLVAAPVLAACAAVIRIVDGPPVLFRQWRSGRGGTPFELCKFRTMAAGSDDPATDGARVTPLGRFLRSTSLDELPTLWNVVRGEMSLVGPRPLPVRYLERYTPEQARRLEVDPGVTGLAQVRGRNRLAWEDRFALDVAYVEHRGLGLDLRILAATARLVVAGDGVEADGSVTAAEFTGPRRP
ncbi:MAG: sugar transferase [Acidimicrobiales bacterium]